MNMLSGKMLRAWTMCGGSSLNMVTPLRMKRICALMCGGGCDAML